MTARLRGGGEMIGGEERVGEREEGTVAVVVEGQAGEVAEEEERVGEKGLVSRWDKFLPRMPVRVLLVEGDDSTRQIISALLRKCSYIVAATSDGLKAWDTLKEKPQSIDLVLTEIDLPSISGFGLLTLIMDHDACRNIPVIMMSSHDSVSMVFKCMLKGAADFLIKPLRKNELRNLWQHVWRRQIVSGDYKTHGIEDKCDAKDKLESHSGKIEHSVEHVDIMQANKECSEQGSDAQSSCTRSDVEAESTHKTLELKLPQPVDASMDHSENSIQMENKCENTAKVDAAVTKTVGLIQKRSLDFNDINNETRGEGSYHDMTSKHPELVRVIANQSPMIPPSRDFAVNNNNITCKSSRMLHLELSLKRYEGTFSEKQECDESNVWNHSSSSAFSLYNNRTMIPTLLAQQNSGTESNGVRSLEPLKDQSSTMNMEETQTPSVGSSVEEGMAVQCTPIRVIPFPVPVGDVPMNSGYCTVMQQMFYPQPGHPFWSTTSSILKQATNQAKFSHQTDQADEENTRGTSFHHSEGKQDEHMELDEQMHFSSAAGESGSSICNGVSRYHLNSSESGSVLSGTTGHASTTHVLWPVTVNENDERKKECEGTNPGADCQRLSQREVALNKFRLKRKERCFEKKVRYQSRKLLAEQRPRVKGQFVRQEKPNSRPRLAGAFQSDSAAG